MKKLLIKSMSMLAAMALLLSFAACKGDEKSDLLTTQKAQKSFTSGVAEFAVTRELVDSNGTAAYDLDLVFPAFEQEFFPAADAMSAYYTMIAKDIENYALSNVNNASAFIAANPGSTKWCVKSRFTVTFRNDKYINILCEINYGNGTDVLSEKLQSAVFEIATGNSLTLRDFLSGDKDAFTDEVIANHLAAVVIEKSVDKYGVTTLYPSVTKEVVAEKFDPSNFYFTPDGLTIYFGLNTIAPFSDGVLVYNLSGEDIRGYFTVPEITEE